MVSTTRPISCLTLFSRSGVADLAAEVLRHHDVGGLLRPEPGDLDVALLEDELPLLVADDRRPHLPFDFIERIDALPAEKPLELEARRPRRRSAGCPGHDCGLVVSSDPAELWLWPAATPFCILPSARESLPAPRRDPKRTIELLKILRDPARVLGSNPLLAWQEDRSPDPAPQTLGGSRSE